MQDAKNMKEFHAELEESLEDQFLRKTLDAFAVAYRKNRVNIFSDMDERALIEAVAEVKGAAVEQMEELYEQFRTEAERRGVHVHRAATAAEANEIIARIAADNNCTRIIKSKSMTSEETRLTQFLEAQNLDVAETDLGEWIIQLRHEGPSHMVMPAIHLSRDQVADLFTEVTHAEQTNDISKLVKVARRELRAKFAQADMGITGGNFAVAESAAIGLCTNEGNARLVTTLPRVLVSLVGLEKLVPTVSEALNVIRILPRNATAQAITTYVTWITGCAPCAAAPENTKQVHVVFLDNGRSALAKDPDCKDVLRCVRCGACANVCPVYRLVGGQKMGHIYIGAIGLILTYFYHGRDAARNLVQNCINCETCKNVCAAGIDLPAIIQEIRARLLEEEGSPLPNTLLSKVLKNRKLFHTLLRFGKYAQKPMTAGTPFIRHLPDIFLKGQGFRALPAIADKPFRDRWKDLPKNPEGRIKVAIFSGCVQDFVYPEQLEAAVKVLNAHGCDVDFPMGQSCCGRPIMMMGERETAHEIALQNVRAFDPARYDHILTLCASCGSHIKNNYPRLTKDDPKASYAVQQFASRIRDFSSFVRDHLGLSEADFNKSGEKICYHSPCHLCRGLHVTSQPRDLIGFAADYVPTDEEDTCCGFGGSYSIKFPEISSRILEKKLDRYEHSGATTLVTDCPGCIIQLRGGEEKRSKTLKVEHVAEVLARNLKK